MAKITSLAELTDVASDDLLVVVDKSDTSMADSGTDKKVQKVNLLKGLVPENGWIPAGETWTYASADDPTFTFTISGDKTSKYSAGMRIKLTQTTIKYFIITAVSYSSPNTTITVYGGTDYDLANATITSPYYSMVKAPFGFPMSPEKWRVYVSKTSVSTQSSPTSNTWYNVGTTTAQINIPIGSWDVYYKAAVATVTSSPRTLTHASTLSTANNTNALPADFQCTAYNDTISSFFASTFFARGNIIITTKATYYLNLRAICDVGITSITLDATNTPCCIVATCAYL